MATRAQARLANCGARRRLEGNHAQNCTPPRRCDGLQVRHLDLQALSRICFSRSGVKACARVLRIRIGDAACRDFSAKCHSAGKHGLFAATEGQPLGQLSRPENRRHWHFSPSAVCGGRSTPKADKEAVEIPTRSGTRTDLRIGLEGHTRSPFEFWALQT